VKKLDPYQSLREVNGVTPRTEEQAQFANAAYGRIEEDPAPPDKATGLPLKDAIFSNGGGYSALVSPGGAGDDTPFPENVAAVSGTRSTVDPAPIDFGHRLTPVPEDGFGAAASGVDAIIRRGRG
jgi:hypothetical protein